MRNFIGNLLISLAGIITFLRTCLLFILLIGFCMGIFMMTLLAFTELLGSIFGTAYPEYQLNLIGKWYWEAIILFIGGATMWQGIKKMNEDTKKTTKLLDNWNENPKYHGNP